MKNVRPATATAVKYYRRYVALILLFLFVLLSWHGYHHYVDFKAYQFELITQSVRGASAEISTAIAERQRSVKILAQQYASLIQELALNPDDEQKYTELQAIIKERFPDSFAFTISNNNGEPLLGNFELLINELCQLSIRKFVLNNNYKITLHPHPDEYHIDIMTSWKYKDNAMSSGVFFISFKPTIITRILKNAEIHDHKLYLLNNIKKNLIEISSQGTRIDIPNLDANFYLNEQQINRIGFRKKIAYANWDLVDIPNENIFSNYQKERLIQTLLIITGFLFISLVFLKLVRTEEKIRLKSEHEVEKIKDRLEQALSFSDVALWEYNLQNKTFFWSDRSTDIFERNLPTKFEDYIALIPANQQQSVRHSFEQCVTTGLPHRIEHQLITQQSNNNLWVEITGNIDHDPLNFTSKMIGLARNISIRKSIEQSRLSFEIQQKNTLVREVHHRIKNNLQGVVGLLRQHSKYESIDNTMLEHAISQLNSVSLVHGIQSDDSNQCISVAQLVVVICKATFSAIGVEITPSIQSSGNTTHYLNEKNAVPIALIINELIFNAKKHSSEVSNDNIHIDVESSDAYITIKIQNDGAILPNNFDFEKAIGLGTGLSLIKSLLPRQGATLSIQQSNNAVLSVLILSNPVLTEQGNKHDGQRKPQNQDKKIA